MTALGAWARRQVWWVLAVVLAFIAGAIGRLLDPNWLLGNGAACDTWFSLGEQVLMGPVAHSLFPFSRQTARVADFAPGGFLYRVFDVESAQFLVATLWLAITVTALALAARGLGGPRAYWWLLASGLMAWPLYPAVSNDFVARSVAAWVAVALFGVALSRTRRALGCGIAIAALVIAMFTEPVMAPAALGVVVALGVVAMAPARSWMRTGIGAIAGAGAGLLLLISLGNITGSAPGFAVIDITLYRSMEYLGYSSTTRAQWHSPLWGLVTTSPLLGVVLLLSAPGAAVLLRAAVRRQRALPAGEMAVHAGNCAALGAAMLLQSLGGTWLSAGDYYTAWFVPTALLSAVLVVSKVRLSRSTPPWVPVTAGALAVVAAGTVLWGVGVDVVPPIVLATWAGLLLLVILLQASTAPVLCMLVGSATLIVLTAPSGFGDAAWSARANPGATQPAPADLHRSVVEALSLVPELGAKGPVIWWLSDPEDAVQITLPRGTLQCAVSYPDGVEAPLEAGWGGLYAGYLVGAPARVSMASGAQSPVSLEIPSGQGLLAVLPPGVNRVLGRQKIARALAAAGVLATPRGEVLLPRGHTVSGWSLTCAGKGRCRLRYAPAPG